MPYVKPRHSIETLRKLKRRKANEDIQDRIQAIILAKQGYGSPYIARQFEVAENTIREWCKRYNDRGIQGLRNRRVGGNGRAPKLTRDEESKLVEHVREEMAKKPHRPMTSDRAIRIAARELDVSSMASTTMNVILNRNGLDGPARGYRGQTRDKSR